jgi:hypothetical protein
MPQPKKPMTKRSSSMKARPQIKKRKTSNGKAGVANTPGTMSSWSLIPKNDPFPQRMACKLIYGEEFNLVPTTTAQKFGTSQVFRLNSLYDPDFSGSGDYPYQFPTLQLLYGSYLVTAVNIELTFSAPTSAMWVAALIGSFKSTVDIAANTTTFASSCAGCWMSAINGTGEATITVKKRFTIAEIEGLSQQQLKDNPNYQSLVSTNPASTPWLRIGCAQAGTASTQSVQCVARLIFEAQLFDRINTST